MEQLINILAFIKDSLIHTWPYLLITIPLSAAVKLSGLSKMISSTLNRRPMVSIFLATLIGAFSPFCSCGVIPVIASLLIGGVPLAPVMSFWIASPSMDPEIFFLGVSAIGLELSIWRLAATFVISLISGILTHLAVQKGWIGSDFLRNGIDGREKNGMKTLFAFTRERVRNFRRQGTNEAFSSLSLVNVNSSDCTCNTGCCSVPGSASGNPAPEVPETGTESTCCENKKSVDESFLERFMKEAWKASLMVAKFMSLAFLINALIHFYVPEDYILRILGGKGHLSVFLATITGIPVYTSNITALPLIGGLLDMGMNRGAALAFLLAGPVTTLPAMAAVWGIVRKKVFILYLGCAISGAIITGFLFNLLNKFCLP